MKKVISMKLVLSSLLALILILAAAGGLPLANKAAAETLNNICPDPPSTDPNLNPYRWSPLHTPAFGEIDHTNHPNVYFDWKQVRFTNNGPAGDAYNVKAILTYWPSNVTVLDGEVNLGFIAKGAKAWSTDDFGLQWDYNHPSDPRDGWQWQVEYDDAAGTHYTLHNVPKFYGEHATIGDFVWIDANKDGIQDAGEAGLGGVTVNLYDNLDLLVATDTTDANGIYGFTVTAPGEYYVKFIAPTGYIFSPMDEGGDNAKDSDADSTGETDSFTVFNNTVDMTCDAGLWNSTTNEAHPSTVVGIDPSADQVNPGDKITLTVTEANTGDVVLTSPKVIVDNGVGELAAPPTSGDTNSNSILDVGETWSWTVPPITINADITFTAIGHGTDPLGKDITVPGCKTEQASVPVKVIISPDTKVTITSSANQVCPGGKVTLTVSEDNTGNVPLTDPHVILNPGETRLDATSSGFSGDTNSNGILDTDETWTWTVDKTVSATTKFIATGHGTASGVIGDITYDAYPDEQDDVTVTVTTDHPNTRVSITSSSSPCSKVTAGSKITLKVTETNTGNVQLTNPHVDIALLGLTLTKAPPYFTGGDTNGNGKLDPLETWKWSITNVTVTATTTYTAIGHGTDDSTGTDITAPAYPTEKAEVKVTVTPNQPNTKVTITSSSSACGQVTTGGKITLTITEKNTGNVQLTDPYVYLDPPGTKLTKASTSYTGGDTNKNGKLDVGETWKWRVTNVTVTATTIFTATGHGFDPALADITAPAYPSEQAKVTVTVKVPTPPPAGKATRTPGFWQTHLNFTTYVFTNYLNSDINIGWRDIKNVPDLMGIFWASPSKNSDHSKRTPLCQAKEITAFQAAAAVLNSGLPNGAPLPVSLAQIQTILGGSDIYAIKALGEKLDRYNNSGDRVPIVSPVPIGKANPKGAQAIANIKFADCP